MDKDFLEKLLSKEKKYENLLSAVRLLLSELQDDEAISDLTDSKVHGQEVNTESFIYASEENKVLLCIKAIGQGNNKDILSKWIEFEPNIEQEAARIKVKQWVFQLGKKNKINIVQKGVGKRPGLYAYKQ